MNVTREELVQYAVEYTSFYAEKYAGANLQDGKSLPILTKEEAAHAGVSIISREYYTKLGTPEVKSAYTSGSTGISLEAFSTNAESAGQLFHSGCTGGNIMGSIPMQNFVFSLP